MKTHHILPSVALFLLTFICFSTAEVFADVHMKVRIMNGMTESESWISGDKQKSIAQVPMMGEMTTITDLHKKEQFQLLPAKKVYDRKPLALEYNENMKAFMQGSMGDKFPGQAGKEISSLENCDPKFEKLADKRTYAGYDAEGYRASCVGQAETATFWFAKPKLAFDSLPAMEKELKEFQKKSMEAIYANFPAEEKKEFLERFSNPTFLLGQGMGANLPFKNVPKGFLLAMEVSGGGDPNGMSGGTFFEVLELDNNKVPMSFFEIDSTYTEVEDVSQAIAGDMMKNMGLGNFGKILSEMGVSDGVGDPNVLNQSQFNPPNIPQVQVPEAPSQANALAAIQKAFGQMEANSAQMPSVPNFKMPQFDKNAASNFIPPQAPAVPASVSQALESTASQADAAAIAGMIRKPGPNGWIYERTPDAAQGSGTPPGMIRKPGPNGWIYEPDPDYQAS